GASATTRLSNATRRRARENQPPTQRRSKALKGHQLDSEVTVEISKRRVAALLAGVAFVMAACTSAASPSPAAPSTAASPSPVDRAIPSPLDRARSSPYCCASPNQSYRA